MKNLICIFSLIIFFSCQEQKGTRITQLDNKRDSLSYSLGLSLAKQINNLQMEDYDQEILDQAISDWLEKEELLFEMRIAEQYLSYHAYYLKRKRLRDHLKRNEDFLKENLTRSEVNSTASGLQYIMVSKGSGPKPKADQKVTLHFQGSLIDDTVFKSTRDGDPVEMEVSEMAVGLKEAIMMMSAGSKRKFYFPSKLALGAHGRGLQLPQHTTLIVEIELISIE